MLNVEDERTIANKEQVRNLVMILSPHKFWVVIPYSVYDTVFYIFFFVLAFVA